MCIYVYNYIANIIQLLQCEGSTQPIQSTQDAHHASTRKGGLCGDYAFAELFEFRIGW